MLGKTLAHYTITEKIGAGGMGDVWRARDTKLDRDVALKVLPSDAALDPERRERFEREAKAVAALRHPNIVVIYSVENVDGVRFLTMELVEGQSLAALVAPGGMSVERFLAIARPLVDAVACAHAQGIAHRDLKPANIMVDAGGQLKVLDFGLAKLWLADRADLADPAKTMDAAAHRTEPGHLLGTPAYMSPEQVAGQAIDARSDVFSLGIVFHELLSGDRPFDAAFPAATMTRIVNDEAPGLPGQPPEVAAIVARCLCKSPADRYADADELGRALRELSWEIETTTAIGESSPAAPATAPLPSTPPEIQAAYDQGAWEEALALLRALAERRALSAEELEMVGGAAIWLSRNEEQMQALEKAHAIYAGSGRNRPAARVALDLVAGYVELNRPAVARGWQKRAERLLQDDPECIETGLLLRRQTVNALAAGDLDRALELNRRCAAIAAHAIDADLKVVALHDQGQILIARGDVDEGTALIDEAMADAIGGDVSPMTLGCLFCRTLMICKALADYDRAREWSEVAGQWSEAHAAASFPGICRVHSAETMRHLGQWDKAEQAVREACDFFGDVGPASHAGEAFNELGELSLCQGNYQEAEASFRRAHEYGCDPVPGLPLLRLAQGDGPAALRMIERALTECPTNRLRRAKLLSARISIALTLGENSVTEADVHELTTAMEEFRCPAFRAHASLGRGALALERGDPAAATPILREAWSAFHEAGFVYYAARARVFLAKAYRETGNEEDARLQLDAAGKTFSDLGAQPDLEEVSRLIAPGGGIG